MPPSGDRPAAERALLSLLKGPVTVGIVARDAAVSARAWFEDSLRTAQRHVEDQLGEARELGRSTVEGRKQTNGSPQPFPRPAPPRAPTSVHTPTAPPRTQGSNGRATAHATSSADLPIPDYDELSALQVMDHLVALSPRELAKVRSYEQAGRGRRTILAKIDLLTS